VYPNQWQSKLSYRASWHRTRGLQSLSLAPDLEEGMGAVVTVTFVAER
jgi:hypothetical protein